MGLRQIVHKTDSFVLLEHCHLATLLWGQATIQPPRRTSPFYLVDGKSMLITEHVKKATLYFASTLTPRLGLTNANLVAGWVLDRCGLLPRSLPSAPPYNAPPTHHKLDPLRSSFALCVMCNQARETLAHLHNAQCSGSSKQNF